MVTHSLPKIAFKKKTPVATVKTGKNDVEARQQGAPSHQMRLITNLHGVLVDVNDAFAVQLGVPPLDLKGRNLLDTVFLKDFDDLVDDRAVFNSLSHGEDTGILNLRAGTHTLLMGRDLIPHAFHFDWIKGNDGQKYLVAGSVNTNGINDEVQPDWQALLNTILTPSNDDTAEQKPDLSKSKKPQSEKPSPSKLSLKSKDVSVFAQFSQDMMCVISTEGDVLRGNDEFMAVRSGDSPDGELGSFLNMTHEDDRASVRQYLQSFHVNDLTHSPQSHPVLFESRLCCAQSEKIWWIAWSMILQKGEIYCLGRDITQDKMNEASLKHREEELSEAQALAHMGHWRWKVGAETLEWSEQIYNIFGVTADDFEPTLDNTNALIHKRDIGHMMQAFQRAIIEQNDYDLDFRVVHADDSVRYVRCEGRCELDHDGDVVALYGIMQDVTAQMEHELELRAAKDSAEQAYASKSRFLANMSHELRTPLNAIIGFSDMIERQMLGAVGNDKYLEYATSIKESGEHLLALITDILDMSKIEAGKYELDLEDIELGAVINCAVRMIESRAQEGVITLNSHVDNDEPRIIADRRAVMQILLNILSNAVKFTEPGGIIDIGIEEFDNHVTIKITDTGVGIPANKLSAVLRPFEQVSTAFTRNHEGSGLGLAITKELAEMHGGMIALESREGEGTIATIRLPRDAQAKRKS